MFRRLQMIAFFLLLASCATQDFKSQNHNQNHGRIEVGSRLK